MCSCRFSLPMVLAMALVAGGCGSMTRTAVDSGSRARQHYKTRSGRSLRVQVAGITVSTKLDEELKQAVARYLRHQATDALGHHDIFETVDRQARPADLLERFMQVPADARPAVVVDAVLNVEIIELNERKGATVRVGLLSQQSKHATARVRVTLALRNGKTVTAVADGKAVKGAWGVVAMTDRRAMDRKGGVWELDGSMAGTACAEAVQTGVGDLAGQVYRDMRRMKPDAVERWLR